MPLADRVRSEDRTVVYGMDLFEREGDCWYREQEEHTERAWSQQELEQVLREAGFCSIQRYGGVDRRSVTGADRRIYYVCVNGEGGQTPGQCSGADSRSVTTENGSINIGPFY